MAPIQTKHSRAVRSAKNPRGIYAPPSATDLGASSTDFAEAGPSTAADDAFAFSDKGGFRVNKKDKRAIRHNALLAKVRDGGVQKRALKRRRPTKKLKTDVGDLADALPEVEDEAGAMDEDDDWEGISEQEEEGTHKVRRRRRGIAGDGKMVMRSLKHRPGAMKRKRKMEQSEMERFGKNLAQMVGQEQMRVREDAKEPDGDAPTVARSSQADRWAALRKFIGGTMQKDRAFAAT
ncbi:Ribosome biogenesis protein SLX9 [Teratosphaeria destructans]|uniref:Ribosome biogenesis protein SLX9 n=1 Tax=Teratosphaeria destructans TaxID=418781 RepID=A0A9W7W2D5_9PEZI|nr:Ribosome biogenesis protein SLX9 [Teratosphaeria destructans]